MTSETFYLLEPIRTILETKRVNFLDLPLGLRAAPRGGYFGERGQ